MKRPLLLLAAALAVGCLVGEGAGKPEALALLALGGGLLGLALRARSARPAGLALGAAALALGAAGAALERMAHEGVPLRAWVEARSDDAGTVLLEGRARGDGEDRPDRLRVTLDVERVTTAGRVVDCPGRVRVDVFGEASRPEIRKGDRVRAWVALRRVTGHANPGGEPADLWARHEGLAALGHVKS